MGLPNASVCVTHHGVGSLSAFVQPFQVWPAKMKGKLHSELGSDPYTVEQVEIGAGGGRPEKKQDSKYMMNNQDIILSSYIDIN